MPDPQKDRMPEAIRTQIDQNVRRLFDEAADEAVPSHLLALIEKLREKDRKGGK